MPTTQIPVADLPDYPDLIGKPVSEFGTPAGPWIMTRIETRDRLLCLYTRIEGEEYTIGAISVRGTAEIDKRGEVTIKSPGHVEEFRIHRNEG